MIDLTDFKFNEIISKGDIETLNKFDCLKSIREPVLNVDSRLSELFDLLNSFELNSKTVDNVYEIVRDELR